MPYKFCPNCFATSYSSVEHSIWLCPHCGKDISFMQTTTSLSYPLGWQPASVRPRHLRVIPGGKN